MVLLVAQTDFFYSSNCNCNMLCQIIIYLNFLAGEMWPFSYSLLFLSCFLLRVQLINLISSNHWSKNPWTGHSGGRYISSQYFLYLSDVIRSQCYRQQIVMQCYLLFIMCFQWNSVKKIGYNSTPCLSSKICLVSRRW